MTIHAKKINYNGTNNMVSFTGNIGATELQLTNDTANTYQATPPPAPTYDPTFSRIESVYNFSGADFTFQGYTFAAGPWKFADVGGLKLAAPISGAIAGNARVLITLRS